MISFFKKEYHRLNKLVIAKNALVLNHQALQSVNLKVKIAPVLKSNAYGHGLKQAATIFDKLDAPFLVVDSLYEAYELYKLKVKTPILIIGYTNPQNFKVKKLPFHFTVWDFETAKILSKHQPGCYVHIFVDTGMHREGVQLNELADFVQDTKKLNLKIEGLCSHLADADNPRSQAYTKTQVENYKKAMDILQENGVFPQWRHIGASAGLIKVIDPIFNMARVGLSSYGLSPLEKSDKDTEVINLTPALKLVSHVAQIKYLEKGDKVGYNCQYIAKKEVKIAVLSIGYNDGLDRRLSNKGFVKIGEQFCPIAGRISMNITTVDVSEVEDINVGDEVIIFSDKVGDRNSFDQSAKLAGTINYDLLVGLKESIFREIK